MVFSSMTFLCVFFPVVFAFVLYTAGAAGKKRIADPGELIVLCIWRTGLCAADDFQHRNDYFFWKNDEYKKCMGLRKSSPV